MSIDLLCVNGVKCSSVSSGIKNNNSLDLSLISLIDGTNTAAVFTQNIFCAAPVLVAKNHLNSNIKALLINSGNANAGTGKQGLEDSYKSCEIIAEELSIKPEQVLPFSTGVIGQLLPVESIEKSANKLVNSLTKEGLGNVAKGILTTDLVEKYYSVSFKVDGVAVNLSGVAKGSGMIRPNMATMLSFIVTDIGASQDELQQCLDISVNQSFNRITVDGDTSTNDACTLSATNQSGILYSQCKEEFQKALNELTRNLAHKIVKDGEGSTKFVEVSVSGLESNEDCLEVAYTVAHSPLVKTALFASDANWGRILAAVGRARVKGISFENINISLNEVQIISSGEISDQYSEEAGSREMEKPEITIRIDLGGFKTNESVWTTDLSYEYVKINAEYRS
jgi:glutamate N-acetyltransferase/amino-acid N-acetyltransferase|tara:strand:- start:6333 stop:7517 length:1185 start_codon:yes stop_codon:yes gene_type:complete